MRELRELGALLLVGAWGPICFGQTGAHNLAARQSAEVENVPERNPFTSPSDLAMGQTLFVRRCSQCHGRNGEGGRGVALTTGQYRLGGSDRELYLTIRNGIPNSDMPGSARSMPVEIWQLVGYVRRLGSAASAEKTAGDPDAGRAVYEKSGCAQCHMLNGVGGELGPDLSSVGRQRSLQYLRDSILDPSADVPNNYRADTVTTLDGKVVRGIHLNEDDYSLQIRDASGNPRSFLKSDLKSFTHEVKSVMPSYKSLPPADLDDLVAYLKSMR